MPVAASTETSPCGKPMSHPVHPDADTDVHADFSAGAWAQHAAQAKDTGHAKLSHPTDDVVNTHAGVPVLRLLRAPRSEPPYDDQIGDPFPDPQEAAYLEVPSRPGTFHGNAPPVAAASSKTGADIAVPHAASVDPTSFATSFVQRLLEVCGGVRPIQQLRSDTTPELYEDLERALGFRRRATGIRPTGRDVRSVHVQQHPDGAIAEVCATVRRGQRIGALALRLESRQGRWTCTRLVGV